MSNMKKNDYDIDHEVERRKAEFNLGHVEENYRLRHRFAAWMAIFIIGIATVVIGTVTVWLP